MYDIKDKTVLITGGAAGIGASIVRALLEEEVKHITILDIAGANGLALEKELNTKHGKEKVKFIKCDITEEKELLEAFERVTSEQGYLDVVINNAGIFNDSNYVQEININFTALVRSSIHGWKLMRKDGTGKGGTIVNIASIAAMGSLTVVPVYSATKAGVVKFSTMLGDKVTFDRTGVRTVTLCFGVTDTQLIRPENYASFDSTLNEMIPETLQSLKCQTPENAAQGLLQAYKKGQSASVWVITSGKPAIDVTEKYIQSSEIFRDIIHD